MLKLKSGLLILNGAPANIIKPEMITLRRSLELSQIGGSEMAINRDFYSSGSGERYSEQLTRAAQADASNVSGFWYQLAMAHQVKRAAPLLEQQLVEQAAKIEDINMRLAEIDKQLKSRSRDTQLISERDALSRKYTVESTALRQIEQAIRFIGTLKEPTAPDWLLEWLKSV